MQGADDGAPEHYTPAMGVRLVIISCHAHHPSAQSTLYTTRYSDGPRCTCVRWWVGVDWLQIGLTMGDDLRWAMMSSWVMRQ